MKIDIYRVNEDVQLPEYGSVHAAAVDLRAYFSWDSKNVNRDLMFDGADFDDIGNRIVLPPGSRCLVPTGLFIAVPDGYEAVVRPRSGLALKHGITVLNSPGTIDADYRGEIGVILINHSNNVNYVENNERIAQLGIRKIENIEWEELVVRSQLGLTLRGEGGFGSTGQE